MKISIVVPLFNEESSIYKLYEELKRALDSTSYDYEVIFVDDGSIDSSYRKISELFNKHDNIKIIQLRRNFGKSAALSCGFRKAEGEIVVTMDADLQDLPEEIPGLIKELTEKDLDLVSGWRAKRFDSISKKFFSFLFNKLTFFLTGIKLHDFNCGLKVYKRQVVDELNIYGELHRYIPVLVVQKGFKVGEVKVSHAARKWGKSKYGIGRLFNGFFDLLTILFITKFQKRPLHLFGFIGMLFLLTGLAISGYFAFLWVMGRPMYIRPMIVLGWVMIILGIQFISIGFLGDMINTSNKSPREYSVKNILE